MVDGELFKKLKSKIYDEKRLVEKIDTKTVEGQKKLEQLSNEFEQTILQAKQESDTTLGGMRQKTFEVINKLFAKNDVNRKLTQVVTQATQKISEVDAKLTTVRDGLDGKDGQDGKDADEEKIVGEVLSKIKLPEVNKDENEELKKEIEELKKRKFFGRGGGGFSKIAMDGHIVDDEIPSGTVDGVTTAFTLTTAPNPISSLKVYVNGQRMKAGGEDYTLSGRTITFITAPPTGSILLTDYRT